MTKLSEKVIGIEEKLMQAYNFNNGSTANFVKFLREYREEAEKIKVDRYLTSEGKAEMILTLKDVKTFELMNETLLHKAKYEMIVNAVLKEAEEVANEPFPAVDQVRADQFEKELSDLKTSVLLSTNVERSLDEVVKFVDATKENSLLDRVRGEFASLVAPIIGSLPLEKRELLNSLFADVKDKALGPDRIEALKLIEQAKVALNAPTYELTVQNAVQELGMNATKYLNDPQAYINNYIN